MSLHEDSPAQTVYLLPTSASDDGQGSRITLGEVLSYLFRVRLWIGISALFGIAVGFLLFSVMHKYYAAQTILSPAQQSASALGNLGAEFGGLASLAGVSLPKGNTVTADALAILNSPGFMARFIQKRNLMPVLYPKLWDAQNKRWKNPDPEKVPTIADASLWFSKSILTVERDEKSGIVRLSVRWRDRFLAAKWANEIVDDLNSDLRQRAVDESQRSIQYLNGVLKQPSIPDAEQRAIYSLIESQLATATVANVRSQYAFRVLDPARAPDEKRFVSPNLPLLLLGGMFGAIMAGLGLRLILVGIHLPGVLGRVVRRIVRWLERDEPGHAPAGE